MSEQAIADTPATAPVAVVPASGVTPLAESPATVNQAAADAAAAAAAKTSTSETPADVAYTLALPKDAVIEASAIERLTAFAKAEKLSPQAAQKTLDLANAEVKADREALAKTWSTLTRETWVTESKNDKEVGGDRFLPAVENAKRVMDKYADEEFKAFLNETGFGNNKQVLRLMNRIGQSMSNDTLVNGNSGGTSTPKTDAQVLYPNMNP